MTLKEGVNIMSKILLSPVAKALALVIMFFITIILTSATTQRSASEQLSDYAKYQFKQSIREVLSEDVIPKIEKQGEAIARLEVTTSSLVSGTYDTYVKDIMKYYEKYKKGDVGDFTKTNFDAMAGWWMVLPESRKTDALAMKYKALMDYYPNLK